MACSSPDTAPGQLLARTRAHHAPWRVCLKGWAGGAHAGLRRRRECMEAVRGRQGMASREILDTRAKAVTGAHCSNRMAPLASLAPALPLI